MHKCCKSISLLGFLLLGTHSLYSQTVSITSHDGKVSMKVTEARPLEELVNALSERYGWILDYEDPVYSDSEVKDDTDPAWRASHPTAARTNSPKGISFAATLPPPGVDC